MTRTYRWGWGGARLTLDDLNTRPGWARVDPEMRRRLIAFADASQDAGREVGFGEGWRSSAVQERVFRERHTVVTAGGCCRWGGQRWALRPGMAHAAPPGRSYHEETTPTGHALAVDLVGDLAWGNANDHRFGLRNFATVNREPWHVQPVEIPTSRAHYQPAHHHPLPAYPLPHPPPPPPPSGGHVTDLRYTPFGPVRLVDTRDPAFRGGQPAPRSTIVVPGHPWYWPDTKAVAAHVTIVRAPTANFVTAWSGVGDRPVAATVNAAAGATVNGFTIVACQPDGSWRLYTDQGGHVTVDVVGILR